MQDLTIFQLYFRVIIMLACRTGDIFLRFSGERGQARGERRVRVTRDAPPRLALAPARLKNANNIACSASYNRVVSNDVKLEVFIPKIISIWFTMNKVIRTSQSNSLEAFIKSCINQNLVLR